MLKYDTEITAAVRSMENNLTDLIKKIWESGYDSAYIELRPNRYETADIALYNGNNRYCVTMNSDFTLSDIARG